MPQPKSPTLLQLLLDWIQRPAVWVPGFAALLALVFITEWVVHPEAEVTATNTIVNEDARSKLTPEQSALASEIDDLDVLLTQLDGEANAQLLQDPKQKKGQKESQATSETRLDLPTFKINDPVIGVPGDTGEANLERSSVLRNFFSSRNATTEPTGSDTASGSAIVVNESDQGTLSLSLQPPATPLFGAPQSIGLPQVLPATGLNSPGSGNRTTTTPVLPAPPALNPTGYPYNASGSSATSGTPSGYRPPYNTPYNNTPYNAPTYNPVPATNSGGAYGSGGTTTSNPSNNFSSGSEVPVSPYALDSSFSNPLAPPEIPAPDYRLAPGQYTGNGEINTFANP